MLFTPLTYFWGGLSPVDPTNYAERTRRVLQTTPYAPSVGPGSLWLAR